jgi:transposase
MGRRGYPPEFRRKVLDLIEAGRPIAEVAQALGISAQSIYTRRRQDRIDRGLLPGLSSPEKEELAAARRRIAQLETELAVTRRTPTAAYVRALASLCDVAAHLLRFDAAELDARAADATAQLTAATRRAAILARQVEDELGTGDPIGGPLLAALADADAITSGEQVGPLVAGWANLPIPPLVVRGPRRRTAGPLAAPGPNGTEQRPVAVALASIDGLLVTGPQVLRPGTAYTLRLEVRTGDWPEWADRLDAELVGQLSEAEAQTPTFTWQRLGHGAVDRPDTLKRALGVALRAEGGVGARLPTRRGSGACQLSLAAPRHNENVTAWRFAGCAPPSCSPLVCARPRSPASSRSRPRPSASGTPAGRPAGPTLCAVAGRAARLPGCRTPSSPPSNRRSWKAPPPTGSPGSCGLLIRIAIVIERLTGVRYHPAWVWAVLRHRLGWTVQRPVRRAAERDQAAIDRWVKERWPRILQTPNGAEPAWSSSTSPRSA